MDSPAIPPLYRRRAASAGLPLLLVSILVVSPLDAGEDRLRAAQGVLKVQGYYFGEVNGEPSEETTQSLKRFQVRNLLPVTGQLDETTARVLEALGASKSAPAPAAVAAAGPAGQPAAATGTAASPAKSAAATLPHPPGGGPQRDAPAAAASTPPPRKENGWQELATASRPSAATKEPAKAEAPVAAAPAPLPQEGAKPTAVTVTSTPTVAPPDKPKPAVASSAGPTSLPSPISAAPVSVAVDKSAPAAPAEPAPAAATATGTPTSDRATVVSHAQRILQQQGFYRGEINGTRDSRLFQAVRQFQQAKGLAASGELDQATMDSLGMDRSAFAPPPKIVKSAPRPPKSERADPRERPEHPERIVRAERVERPQAYEIIETVTVERRVEPPR